MKFEDFEIVAFDIDKNALYRVYNPEWVLFIHGDIITAGPVKNMVLEFFNKNAAACLKPKILYNIFDANGQQQPHHQRKFILIQ